MQKIIKLLVVGFLLVQSLQAQVTPVVSPAANVPKLVIPATFTGKVKLADSMQVIKTPIGVMLKTFLPQYSPQFQEQLIEALIVIDQALRSNNMNESNYWFENRAPELIRTVRTQYPEITRPMIYKIFYTFCYSRNPAVFSWVWPWLIEEKLNESYGQQKSDPTGPKYLKEAKVPVETVFSYYAYKTALMTDPSDPSANSRTTSSEDYDKYSVKTTVYKFLRGGFSPTEIYTCMRNGGYRSKFWIVGFCLANSMIETPVESVARILKNDRITGDQLTDILSQVPDYNKPENLLKAQMAN
jgi:hypothetical protein